MLSDKLYLKLELLVYHVYESASDVIKQIFNKPEKPIFIDGELNKKDY